MRESEGVRKRKEREVFCRDEEDEKNEEEKKRLVTVGEKYEKAGAHLMTKICVVRPHH